MKGLGKRRSRNLVAELAYIQKEAHKTQVEVLPPRYAKHYPTSFRSTTRPSFNDPLKWKVLRNINASLAVPTARTWHVTQWNASPLLRHSIRSTRVVRCVTGSPQPRGTYFELDILFVIHRTNRCSPPLSYLYSNSKGQSAPWTRYRYPINLIITTPSISVRVSVPCQLPDLFLQICTESRSRRRQLDKCMLSSVRYPVRRVQRRHRERIICIGVTKR